MDQKHIIIIVNYKTVFGSFNVKCVLTLWVSQLAKNIKTLAE